MTGTVNARDGGEHALVEAEQKIRDLGTTNTGLAQDLHETEVAQVADESAARVRKGQGVAPEEPLEADDSYGHHGQPDQRQRRLPPRQTAVEETNARDHEQDKRRRGHDPCEVARL
jgi:hypothetical protein